jgi:hypothetical protein
VQATDAADKDRALRALARVTTKALISETLEYAISPAVRTQDAAVLLVRLAKQGGLGFNMTWQFVMDRADDILKKYGGKHVCCGQVHKQLHLSYSWLQLARCILGRGKMPGPT